MSSPCLEVDAQKIDMNRLSDSGLEFQGTIALSEHELAMIISDGMWYDRRVQGMTIDDPDNFARFLKQWPATAAKLVKIL
ncbi:MAG: hypothetical protein LLG04_11320 [Parachlamydia sp.]|nr:hypothetical protein [Parachlamydia sp.]